MWTRRGYRGVIESVTILIQSARDLRDRGVGGGILFQLMGVAGRSRAITHEALHRPWGGSLHCSMMSLTECLPRRTRAALPAGLTNG